MATYFSTLMASTISSVILAGALNILGAVIIYLVGTRVIKFTRKLVVAGLNKSSVDKGVVTFLDSVTKFALFAILAFIILGMFGVETTSILALFASAGVAVGLALQGSLSNLAGGVLILLLKPFAVGDYIVEHSSGSEGVVTEIEMFYTRLTTADNRIIILPNGNLSNNSITNVTTSKMRRVDIIVGIDYSADLKKAKDVLLELIQKDEDTLKDKDLVVFVDSLGDSSVNLCVRFWLENENFWTGKWRLTENVKLTLDANNISIPFPQLDVKIKNQ
ncbi:MAG: mechanosensitive ion channel [Lachnospiraceae bacterium]